MNSLANVLGVVGVLVAEDLQINGVALDIRPNVVHANAIFGEHQSEEQSNCGSES